jgi:hypothetical protein
MKCPDTTRIRTTDVWIHALNGDLNRFTRVELMRICSILRKLGYEQKVTRFNGKLERMWYKTVDLVFDDVVKWEE